MYLGRSRDDTGDTHMDHCTSGSLQKLQVYLGSTTFAWSFRSHTLSGTFCFMLVFVCSGFTNPLGNRNTGKHRRKPRSIVMCMLQTLSASSYMTLVTTCSNATHQGRGNVRCTSRIRVKGGDCFTCHCQSRYGTTAAMMIIMHLCCNPHES